MLSLRLNIYIDIEDIDKYAGFIVNAFSTAVDKVIPTSKSGRPESQPVSDETVPPIKENVGLGGSTFRQMPFGKNTY